jgi:hypothetical protein
MTALRIFVDLSFRTFPTNFPACSNKFYGHLQTYFLEQSNKLSRLFEQTFCVVWTNSLVHLNKLFGLNLVSFLVCQNPQKGNFCRRMTQLIHVTTWQDQAIKMYIMWDIIVVKSPDKAVKTQYMCVTHL